MIKSNHPLSLFIYKEAPYFHFYALLILLGFACFSTAISFVPADGDDLILLSSVANTPNPLRYFIDDWGLGNNAYRPLHSISLWIFYNIFGVSSGYNQLLNLVMHIVIVCLLLRLITQAYPIRFHYGFFFASLSLASIYTVSSATWVSDRPSLFVAFSFLLLLNHLYRNGQPVEGRIPWIIAFSVLALLGKESGLIVPFFLLFHAYQLKNHPSYFKRIVIIAGVIIISYISLRFAVFGANVISYTESGYIFGVSRYNDWNELSDFYKYYAYLENVVKNLVAPSLPIFNWEGGLLSPRSLVQNSPIWVCTVLLIILSTRKELSPLQKLALTVVLLNSLVHFSVFRFRTQYLSQIAACIYIATPLPKVWGKRFQLSLVFSIILLIFSIVSINRSLNTRLLTNYELLNKFDLSPIVQKFSPKIDVLIVTEILERYKK